MTKHGSKIPHAVYVVADNLDAALAAGEDLIAVGGYWTDGDPADPGIWGAQRWAVSRFRCHELNLVARMVQARDSIELLAREARRFRPLAQLFVASTGDLAEKFEELNTLIETNFETGGEVIAYLRERGLVDEEAAGLDDFDPDRIGDTFLVAGRVPLVVCMDLIAEFLDAMDSAYDLYPDDLDSDGNGDAQAA